MKNKIIKIDDLTLICYGETLTEKQIIDGFKRKIPAIYHNDLNSKLWFYDFKIAIKDGFDIWCEAIEISNQLDTMTLHFYRR